MGPVTHANDLQQKKKHTNEQMICSYLFISYFLGNQRKSKHLVKFIR